ncbi:MAG: Inorganic pyrophosphatase/exopolyphosphatase [Microgenomates group bacterium GW2011_GWC1_37_8]|nr:MAG: Inorganic pyrophosphatase/exopolyphosphatase [Microgenomates group bacterium GW2011_GWC1_37_8]
MGKIVVTSGQPFTDIDALACAIAYAELLKKEGIDAEAVLPGSLNKSITKEIKKWKLDFSKNPKFNHAKYVLVDISEPKYFATFVKENDVVEIFDHRYGFENYWKERLGIKSRIEMVGACATLIWEEFVARSNPLKISELSANLLSTAIISNTLNFQASVTTQRDKDSFKEMAKFTNLPRNWAETYYSEQDKEVEGDIKSAILNDTKNIEPIIVQLELWDSKKIIFKHLKDIEETLAVFGTNNWFLTSPSINEGRNYLYTKNPKVKKLLEKIINAKFDGDIGTTEKLWLRKEILKKLLIGKL